MIGFTDTTGRNINTNGRNNKKKKIGGWVVSIKTNNQFSVA